MAGIYIHIPFCITRCGYCDFFSTTDNEQIPFYINALKQELSLRKDYLTEEVQTIYFGGGTPSMLSTLQIKDVLNEINKYYTVADDAEITLEANPDDLDKSYLEHLQETSVNRLSVGIQSFIDEHLQVMNRRHTANEAIEVVKEAQKQGFDNISIDLIYGVPGLTSQQWSENLEMAFSLNVQHISAYHLTYEEGTVFWQKLKHGLFKLTDENHSIEQYRQLISACEKYGFEQYEISNFSLPGMMSRHNSSYWQQVSYLGIGPSAHSFNGESRQWNISHLKKYLKGIKQGEGYFEIEELDVQTRYNEYIITALRTKKGVDINKIAQFGKEGIDHFNSHIEKYIFNKMAKKVGNSVILTSEGLFISDAIFEDLIIV